MNRRMRCLVVDDSALYRKVVRDVLAALPDTEVVGVANDGRHAIDQIRSLKPDLVTLDLEMPRLDGLGVLREMQELEVDASAIMVSAFTNRGAEATTEALSLGAFDFILKPTSNSLDESVDQLRRDLLPKVNACRLRRTIGRTKRGAGTAVPAKPPQDPRPLAARLPRSRPDLIAIGVSTGGPQALTRLLPRLPKTFLTPIAIVQHMPPKFTRSLAEDLNRRCQLTVMEATQGQPVRPGEVLIAPGGKHMRVAKVGNQAVVQLTDDPPELNCKPSVDFLFRSVASTFGPKSLGVVLTGMGDDGTLGTQAMKKAGATVFAQDEASCVVYGMPRGIVESGLADEVLPLDQVHEHLIAASKGVLV